MQCSHLIYNYNISFKIDFKVLIIVADIYCDAALNAPKARRFIDAYNLLDAIALKYTHKLIISV